MIRLPHCQKGNPASLGKPGLGEGFDLGDRADAGHREGGREILRNRREEGGRDVTGELLLSNAEEREFSEFGNRGTT